MRYLLLVALLASCSSLVRIKDRVLGIDLTKKIHKGQSFSELEHGIGQPLSKGILSGQDYLFYNTGYAVLENGAVVDVKNYNINYSSDMDFSSYVQIDSGYSDIFVNLGYPQEIVNQGSKSYLRYNNGAIFFDNGKVFQVHNKLYNDDIVFRVKLSSFSDNIGRQGASYFIVPGSDKINPNDFLFKDLKIYISEALKSHGMLVVEDINSADYLIFANFGISDPEVSVETISRPIVIPVYTPGTTTNVYGSYGNRLGSIQTDGQWSSQYAGNNTETYKTVSYNRWLNIEAINYRHWKSTKEIVPVWKILTQSAGPGGDIRLVLPLLALGITNYINKDSGTQLNFTIAPTSLNKQIYEAKFMYWADR